MWTRPCLHAHTGVYVDANAFTLTRVGGRPYVPASAQTCVFANTQSRQTHAPTGTHKHVCKRDIMKQNAHARAGMASAWACLHAHTDVCTRTDICLRARMGLRTDKRSYAETLLQHTHGSTHVCARRNIRAHSQGHAPCAIARARKQMRVYALASLATICVCKLAHRRSCILARNMRKHARIHTRADMCVPEK